MAIEKKADIPHEVIFVEADMDAVSCDGGNGALGHPAVWYVFEGRPEVTCSYCDRIFRRQPAPVDH